MPSSFEPQGNDRTVQEFSTRLLAMIDHAFLHEIQQSGLRDMVRLTGSRNGYLFVREAAPSRIRIHNVVAPGANTAPAVQEHDEDLDQVGYWSACLLAGAPVVRTEPIRFDTPLTASFEPMRRDLAVPIPDAGRIVAVVGVGNRADAYGPDEVALVSVLGQALWRVIVRKRLRDEVDELAR